MSDSKFDFNKLKDNVGGLVGSLKSMINPTGGTPTVDPDDALGLKIAQVTTLLKQMSDAQQEHIKNLNKVSELLNGTFQDIQTLRNKAISEKKAADNPPAAEVKEKKK